MNKQIKELAFEANKDLDGAVPLGFAEKFAELIVKECGQHLMKDEFIGRSDLDWSMVLNEHFGVEE